MYRSTPGHTEEGEDPPPMVVGGGRMLNGAWWSDDYRGSLRRVVVGRVSDFRAAWWSDEFLRIGGGRMLDCLVLPAMLMVVALMTVPGIMLKRNNKELTR